MDKVFFRLREIAVEFPDGSVVGFGHLQPIRKGWVVKVKDQGNFDGEDGLLKAIIIATKTTKTIAGWTDGENELWDVVLVFNDEEKAMKAARKNEQMTIYQIETSTLKWLS